MFSLGTVESLASCGVGRADFLPYLRFWASSVPLKRSVFSHLFPVVALTYNTYPLARKLLDGYFGCNVRLCPTCSALLFADKGQILIDSLSQLDTKTVTRNRTSW